jgi:hypothetical protein
MEITVLQPVGRKTASAVPKQPILEPAHVLRNIFHQVLARISHSDPFYEYKVQHFASQKKDLRNTLAEMRPEMAKCGGDLAWKCAKQMQNAVMPDFSAAKSARSFSSG